MKIPAFPLSLFAAALAALPAPLRAELKLPSIVGDNMVLQRDLDLPVWGWVRRDALEKDGRFADYLATWKNTEATYDYDAEMVKWKAAVEKAKAEGNPAPRPPRDLLSGQHRPGNLFAGVLHPIIGKHQVEVWSADVADPVAVRYAWSDNPVANLRDRASNLPVVPFRTDDWPMITAPEKPEAAKEEPGAKAAR